MAHNHKCCCKHLNLKFCEKCGVPYCVDCGREWFDKCTLNHNWSYAYTSIPSATIDTGNTWASTEDCIHTFLKEQ